MNSAVNLTSNDVMFPVAPAQGVITLNLDDPVERALYLSWLTSVTPEDPNDQAAINRCIMAVAGFPSYEVFQQ